MTTHQAVRQTLIDLTQTAEQAASEIVRLREESASLKREILVYHEDRLKLSNEVDQLKAALGLIASLGHRPADEPVANASAWFALVVNAAAELEDASHFLRDEDAKRVAISGAKYYRDTAKALYIATPTQRQSAPDPKDRRSAWVGLTDDEVTICHSLAVLSKKHDGTDPSFTTLLHRQIEAKLREKNGGAA